MNDLREQRDPELRLGSSLATESADKELTLSTGTVLGIFLALALSWAIFFGFGYTMGRKSMQPATTASDSTDTSDQFGKFKPSAGTSTPAPTPAADTSRQVVAPTTVSTATASTATTSASTPAAAPVETKPVAPAPVERTPPPPAPVPINITPAAVPPANTPVMVQIAAVSHKEDADVLTSALERRGYKVIARQDVNDHLIHVQVGPFPTRKDAEAMRARLLGDGYNAIIK